MKLESFENVCDLLLLDAKIDKRFVAEVFDSHGCAVKFVKYDYCISKRILH